MTQTPPSSPRTLVHTPTLTDALHEHTGAMYTHILRADHVAHITSRIEGDALFIGLDTVLSTLVDNELGVHSDEEVSCDEIADAFTWWLSDAFCDALVARSGPIAETLAYSRTHRLFEPTLHARLMSALMQTMTPDAHEALLVACVHQWKREGDCKVCRTAGRKRARRVVSRPPRDEFVALLVSVLAGYE